MRALTLLNLSGDVTIVWEPENDEKMLPLIEAKMKQGFTFFLIEPRLGGLAPPDASKPLKKAADALKHRALAIRDGDFEALVSAGGAALVPTPSKPARTVRKAKTPADVVKAESVAVQPMRGG
ncbi:hypothetical protein OOZ54_12475 [Rhodopseudomonas palustris]|uniref:hypothetical protein n=1 Tax=Rhodopseudomonas palustris TaxID=1076 RepID=UPI0022F07F76|nr:hypothetical protein [Rhodopseudomonas palustris]WBU27509.1 hypothetical protein OOZ54_12475 [Rhodopseudomonas palustris]